MSGHVPYPLEWPVGKKRCPQRVRSQFTSLAFGKTSKDLMAELHRFGARQIVISTNVPVSSRTGLPYTSLGQPDDPGVAVYFTIGVNKPRYYAIACDSYRKVEENMRALVHTIAAMRTIDRHGGSQLLEQAMSGFAALPPGDQPKTWRSVLGMGERAKWAEVRERHRELVLRHHPDRGGSEERMAEINRAFEEAEKELVR